MSDRKILTIFGSTGNQGGSILDTYLSHPELSAKYALRGITRNPSSAKSKALQEKGVEMVKAELDDLESLKAAVKGSYGVFGVTDFWSILDKQREIRQGKNIFEASKAEGVQHLVFSSLPWAEKLTNGVLKQVEHFDSKAEVGEYIEANKGEMIASYFQPAMFLSQVGQMINNATLAMPFPSENIPWPLLHPRRDSGPYVLGIFEKGAEANGVKVHAVSAWTTPKDLVAAVTKAAGQEVKFQKVSNEDFKSFMPENIAQELLETMLLVGDYSYYGPGEEKNQEQYNKWLVKDAKLITIEEWAQESAPWKF